MANPSASRVAEAITSIATRGLRAMSQSISRRCELKRNSSTAATLLNSALCRPVSSAAAFAAPTSGANPRIASLVGELCDRPGFTSFREFGFRRSDFGTVPFRSADFSSRLHGWGAPRRDQLMSVGGVSGGLQQVRNIFVEVRGNDLERAIRKWKRKCKEENLKVLKDRDYFSKPSEKRILALKERDRRIARKSFKRKLHWILNRRQRGF